MYWIIYFLIMAKKKKKPHVTWDRPATNFQVHTAVLLFTVQCANSYTPGL